MNHSKGMVLSLNKVVDIDSSSVNIISICIEKRRKRYVIYIIIGKENQKVKELFSALNYYDIYFNFFLNIIP
jgi:ABC-type transporter Mla MlaB component